jgi:hypothetical protein
MQDWTYANCSAVMRQCRVTSETTTVQFHQPLFQRDPPTLILGLIGFTREHEHGLQTLLESRLHSSVRWRLGEISDADAWWVNGARAQLLDDGSLRVGGGQPGARSVRLSLAEVDRPVAFSEPLANRDFEPAYSFSIDDAASMEAMLTLLQTHWLGSVAARLWLAARLIAAERALTHRIYHVVHAGRLLAIVDRTGDIGLAPGLTVEELEEARWSSRPSSAGAIPPSFHRTTVSELVRSYALRASADLLPGRYRTEPIIPASFTVAATAAAKPMQ